MDGSSYAHMDVNSPGPARRLGLATGSMELEWAIASEETDHGVCGGRLAGQPGKSIPELFTRITDINATYDLLDERARSSRMRFKPVTAGWSWLNFALPVDTSSWRTLRFRPTPIASSRYPGWGRLVTRSLGSRVFLLHSILAMRAPQSSVPDAGGRRPPVTILGLADQQYLVRSPGILREPKQAGSRRADPGSRVGSVARLGQAHRASTEQRDGTLGASC